MYMIKIYFYIRFSTKFGQSLFLKISIPDKTGKFEEQTVEMKYLNEDFWTYSLHLPEKIQGVIHYKYILKGVDGKLSSELYDGKTSKITAEEIHVVDTWNFEGEAENAYYTAPFHDVLFSPQKPLIKPQPYKGSTHVFKVKAPLLGKNEVLGLLGSGEQLGEWDADKPRWMAKEGDWWSVKIDLSKENFPVAYKYAVFNTKTKALIRYEDGGNRLLQKSGSKKTVTILHDGFIHLTDKWRGAGVAIPVFSLRSQNSLGVGEFTDIHLLADWAHKIGLKLIQLLPINDTTDMGSWQDSYPYNAISAFALHPLYLNVEILAGKGDKPAIKLLDKKRKQLNELTEVDYDEVLSYKWKVIRQLYQNQKASLFESDDFKAFVNQHADWLVPYVAFCALRDKNNTANFRNWKQHGEYNKAAVEKLVKSKTKLGDEAGLHLYVQYHLHTQLKAAVDYAHKKGIVLKGDIAIGVSRNSCDVWMEPSLFNTDMQAGAPPDAFAAQGQNWGFPTYNWDKMRSTGFEWWRKRFTQMANYFDLFRVDHLLGFFRIWSIPIDQIDGIMGRFVPAEPVHINEFAKRGITFEYSRFCDPYITDRVLEELMGEFAESIHAFLHNNVDGTYRLKEEYQTQRLINDHFAEQELTPENEKIKAALFYLTSNVLVFEEPDSSGQHFHFRIGIENISSFRHLDGQTQYQLKQLYNDYFFVRQDELWAEQATGILRALKVSTNMLICGEDLGMVPACVPEVMYQLGILSLEVQRMPKQAGWDFFHPALAPYLSVITPGTHDMSTIRGWWEENRELTQRFFNYQLQHPGAAPYFCEPWINKAILIQHLYSPAMWCIFQLQDIMGIDGKIRRQMPDEERINVPAIPRYYWRYRMHITLEQLLKEKDLNKEMSSYIALSGR